MNKPLFLICIGTLLAHQLLSQASIQDCFGAIPVCQAIYQETNSPVGNGNFDEINDQFNCVRTESNSIWYTFTVNQSGDFGFVLTPNDPTDDYDWALFNITEASCSELFSNQDLIVSCNAAGGDGCLGATGATGASSFSDQGFGCLTSPPTTTSGFSPFNSLIPVLEGNTYALCVNNWTGSINGYTLDFSLSNDIGIFDTTPPEVIFVQPPSSCDSRTMLVQFSEPILCSTIDASNFSVTWSGETIGFTSLSGDCEAGGNFGRQFVLVLERSLPEQELFFLSVTPNLDFPVQDLCGNELPVTAFSFNSPTYLQPDLGADTSLCEGTTITLALKTPFGGNATYTWQDGSTEASLSIDREGIYWVEVSSDCGIGADTIVVNALMGAPFVDLGEDVSLCPFESVLLNAQNPGATYEWQDGSTKDNIIASESGLYAVTVSNECGTVTDEIRIELQESIEINLPADTFICPGEFMLLDATTENATSYFWSNGSMNSSLLIDRPGFYWVTLGNDCEIQDDFVWVRPCEICGIFIPNVFSPNGDEVNDRFIPLSDCALLDFNLKVFDRWGGLVFEGNDPEQGWDGTKAGEALKAGVFMWVMEMTVEEEGRLRKVRRAGDVTVLP